jgi:hypothetical protein
MHLLAGGALHGKTIAAASRPATRAVLWAPAVNHDWLAPGRYHGQALNALDRLSLMYNTNDPVMKRYHLGEPGGHPIALGFQGFASLCQLGEAAQRVEHQDAAACVGKSHELVRYCAVESIMQNARKQVFWQA